MPRPEKHDALTIAEVQDILQMMDDGMPNAEISRHSRASYEVVRRIAAGEPVTVTSGRSGRRPKYYPSGENNTSSKLTRAQVVSICREYGAGATAKQLSEKYGVTKGCVASIVIGKRHRSETEGHRKPRLQIRCSGEDHVAAKLTWPIVRRIRADRQKHGTSYKVLAKKHGVTTQNVYRIINNQTWKEPSS